MGHGTPDVTETAPADPACSPEHAAMGHCKPGDEAPATDAGMVGTDLPAGDAPAPPPPADWYADRSEEHTSELQSLMRISYAVFCLKKKTNKPKNTTTSKPSQHNTHTTTQYI